MELLSFEDFAPGSVRRFGSYRVTREEIVSFAREFDPQPFHLDAEAASGSLLGGLAASGWHTFSMMMRLYCDEWANRSMSMGSPGIEEARWLAPVRPGDLLSVRMEIVDARASKSRPEMGLLTIYSEVLDQAGRVVASARHVNMMGRRGSRGAVGGRFGAIPAQPTLEPRPSQSDASFGYFEDVVVGETLELGSHLFCKEDMVRFARAYDSQPFHIDEDAAGRSHFGRLVASGWHTAAAFMKCLVEARDRMTQSFVARGAPPPPGGPSPGFRDLRWVKPVSAGDRLTYFSAPVDKRLTKREGWGLVFSHNVGIDADGAKAFEFTGAAFHPLKRPQRPV